MERVRVAALQYFVRPVQTFDQFRDQVEALVETAADYKCQLVVFPEYFTVQLLTLGNIRRPIHEQIRELASQLPRFLELMADLAHAHRVYIVGGTIPVMSDASDIVHNESYFFSPSGTHGVQGKLHMTRFETEDWKIRAHNELKIFETELGRMAIAICYDVEFPEIARAAARADAHILLVPSCTDDRQGFLRVRYCAQARAIENQMYVVVAHTVGSLPQVPAVHLNYGQAAILTPSDFPFSRDGILAEGNVNQDDGDRPPAGRQQENRGDLRPFRDPQGMTRRRSSILVRTTRREDFPGIRELGREVYPDTPSWTEAQLASHVHVFPEGQLVAVDEKTGEVVGMAASLVVLWDDYDMDASWRDFTDRGMFTNHDPERGRTLYGAEVMVHPARQGQGIGKELYVARRELVKRLGLLRIRAGARLRGYHRHADRMSPEEYVAKVVNGELSDPTVTFQLKQGFHVLAVVPNYLRYDPESLGFAAVIEWINPELAKPEDYPEREPPFYRAAKSKSARPLS